MRRFDWVLVALLAVAFAPAGIGLARVWSSVDYYSHGFLVPLVALWAAHRGGLARRPPAASREPRGLTAIAVAAGVYVFGPAAGLVGVQGLALVGTVGGVVFYLWGWEGLRARAFPVAFLLFMVPLPDAWLTPLILELQLMVSSAAVSVLHSADFTVAREGNVILLPGGESLFVAEACSGITSIVTLTPLAVVLGYFIERRTGPRIALVAAVVPAAMLGNLLRVLITVLAARAVGVERATESTLHEFAGLLTFLLACLALIGLGALLRQFPRPARS